MPCTQLKVTRLVKNPPESSSSATDVRLPKAAGVNAHQRVKTTSPRGQGDDAAETGRPFVPQKTRGRLARDDAGPSTGGKLLVLLLMPGTAAVGQRTKARLLLKLSLVVTGAPKLTAT